MKNKKSKDKLEVTNTGKSAKNCKNNKEVIDLTSFITPDSVQADTDGSYTGTTKTTFYDGELEEPVQDADDL